MAVSANTVWEVRSATGNDANGGGFVRGSSGTDYSQQAEAEHSASDLAIDATNDDQFTSTTLGDDDTLVGNIINITAGTGFTTGRYEITANASGTYTVDRAMGTTGSTGGSGAIGGALATLATVAGEVVAENVVYCVGTFTEQLQPSTSRVTWIGYSSTRTDNGRATIDAESSRAHCVEGSGAERQAFYNWIFEDATSYGFDAGMDSTIVANCVARNCGSQGFRPNHGSILYDCESYGNSSSGFKEGNFRGQHWAGLHSHDNSSWGLDAGAPDGFVVSDLVTHSNSRGIRVNNNSAAVMFQRVTADDNDNQGIEAPTNSGAFGQVVLGCISSNNGGAGLIGYSLMWRITIIGHNVIFGNGSVISQILDQFGREETLQSTDKQADPQYVNASDGAYQCHAGSPARGNGWPQSWPSEGVSGETASEPTSGFSQHSRLKRTAGRLVSEVTV